MAEEEPQYGEVSREKPKDEDAYDVVDNPAPKPAPKIEQPSVLEGFDEDTDFDKDPALKAAQATQAASKSPKMPTNMHGMSNPLSMPDLDEDEDVVAPSTDPLIKPNWLPLKGVATAGAVCAVAAAMFKWYHAPELGSGLPMALLTLYFCALHAVTGMVALIILSLLLRRPSGEYRLGAARILVAVGLFMFLADLGLPWGLSFIPAAAGYMISVMVLFRMRPNVAVQLAGIHGGLFMVVQLGFLLQEWSFDPVAKGGR